MATRRNNQQGLLTLRKDGRWMARVSHEGRRITVRRKERPARSSGPFSGNWMKTSRWLLHRLR